MIVMTCDHCGEVVAEDVNGGCRLKLGNGEITFHLCAEHKGVLMEQVVKFCLASPVRFVK